jgi:predicted acyltransferase
LSLPALIAIAAAVLLALYWVVEKVFSEPDFADKPKVAQPDAF